MLSLLSLALLINSVTQTNALVSNNSTFQHRLALTPDGMSITFDSYSNEFTSKVRYGLHPDELSNSLNATSHTYDTSSTTTHKAIIPSLEKNTNYFYQTSLDCDKCPPSQIIKFKTPIDVGDNKPFTFAVFGDGGTVGKYGLELKDDQKSWSQSLSENRHNYEFIWHNGDLAYADEAANLLVKDRIEDLPNVTLAEQVPPVYETILEAFMNQTSTFACDTPYMVGVGNHEANCVEGKTYTDPEFQNSTIDAAICPPGQTNFTFFKEKFQMPGDESGGLGNFWYKFELGLATFIQINTETDLGSIDGPEVSDEQRATNQGEPYQQLNWLRYTLSNIDRNKTPWVIMAGHRPFYGSTTDCDGCKEIFEDMLNEFNVDLVFFGHVHLYERMAPLRNSIADPNELNNPSAPWYITVGSAGHSLGNDQIPDNLVPYSRYITNEFGYSQVSIHNATHLTHSFMISTNGTQIDEMTIYKEHNFTYDSQKE